MATLDLNWLLDDGIYYLIKLKKR